jgi:hypothetical protein
MNYTFDDLIEDLSLRLIMTFVCLLDHKGEIWALFLACCLIIVIGIMTTTGVALTIFATTVIIGIGDWVWK